MVVQIQRSSLNDQQFAGSLFSPSSRSRICVFTAHHNTICCRLYYNPFFQLFLVISLKMDQTDQKLEGKVEPHDKDEEEPEDEEEHSGGDQGDINDDADKDGRGKKRKKDLSEEERLEERRAANRRSALESRQRRKNLIESLQKQVEQLIKETTELRAVNDTLRLQLDSSLAENQQFRLIISQQQIASGGASGLPGFGQNAALLLGRGGGGATGGFAGLNPALAGVQQGMFGGLGALNPAIMSGFGTGFGAGAGFGAGTGFGAAELQAQLQMQQQREVAAAMGLSTNGMPQNETAGAGSGRGGNAGNKARNSDDDNVDPAVTSSM